MDFGMVSWIFMAIIVFLHLPTKYSSRELILLISTVEPMAAMEMRKILQDQFSKQKIYVHFHSGIEHEDRILTVERLVEDLKQVLGNKTSSNP